MRSKNGNKPLNELLKNKVLFLESLLEFKQIKK
jgi:hypothetical protein